MRKTLVSLYNELEATVPKHAFSRSGYISPRETNVNDECRNLFDHLANMRNIIVRSNSMGIDVIRDTDIRVLKSSAFGPYIESRYGKLVIPAKVNFL